MKIWINIHKSDKGNVIAVCDDDVLGNIYEEGDFVLNVSREFYGGELKQVEFIVDIIKSKNFSSINIVGNKIIDYLLDSKMIKNFKEIGNVKYSHIYLL